MKEYIIHEPAVLEESLQTERLVIEAAVSAPAGKNVTLTVDGVQKNIVPGIYEGDVQLTVTEGFGRAGGFGPPVIGTDFTAAIRGEDGSVVEGRSVLAAVQGGSLEGGAIKDAKVVSEGNEFSGIDLENGEYTLEDVTITMNGYGGSDFNGKGVALAIGGNAKVTAERLNIQNSGVIRDGVVVTESADVVIRDSEITCLGGTDQEYLDTIAVKKGMLNVPWQLGLKGNCRATNVMRKGTVLYDNCKVSSWGWGVLSTDDTSEVDRFEDFSVHLTAKDSDISVLGPSGYAAFSIGPCLDRFINTRVRAADYALIQGDQNASAEYQGCQVYSRRFGTMSYANQGGTISIRDSEFKTEKATFLIKGCYPQIDVSNSTLVSQEGVILQLMDCDDPTYSPTGKFLDSAAPEKIPEHDVTKVNFGDFYLFNRLLIGNRPTDVQARFSDMTLTGDLFNGIANRCPVGSYDPSGRKPFEVDAPPEPELQADFAPGKLPGEPDSVPGAFPAPGDPDPGMSEMSFVEHPSTNSPINLAVTLDRVQYTGRVSAVRCKHAMDVADREHYDQLGVVTNTLAPVVNNGVILTLGGGSSWTVTGDCFLSALHIAADSVVTGQNGKTVTMTVDGVQKPVIPGDYTGDIRITLT